jgi:BirA family biotin operon repressor/biotin-[acetyl-CoA-carboxylase] ligase
MFLGNQIFRLDKVDSTNNFAANLIEEQLCRNGALILADTQTAGKGQRGSLWESEPGKNLLCSYVYFPDNLSVNFLQELNMCLSISLIKCLNYFEIDAEIKWPNDILVNGKKISGILIENNVRAGKVKSMIFGIGLNINQQSFLNLGATSMALIRGAELSIDEVSLQLTKEFNHWISFVGGDHQTLKLVYLNQLYGLNMIHRFQSQAQEFEGVIVGVNDFGDIEINILGEIRSFKNKEISFLM